jgi:type IV pilus assembly protein PilW
MTRETDPQVFRPALAHRRVAGMTLIELLVALAIGSFLMIGAITVFMQSRTTFRINEAVARLQENARFLLDEVEPDIRMASYFGLTTRSNRVQGRATAADPIGVVPLASDCRANWSIDLALEVEGTNNIAGPGAWPWPNCPAWGADGVQPQSDALVVRRASEDPVLGALAANAVYVQSARFQDSQIFVGNAIPAGYLPATSQTHLLVANGYYVSRNSSLDTPGNPVPSLRRKSLQPGPGGPAVVDQEVLAGVEDMQVQFGVDTDAVGTANRGVVNRYVSPNDPIITPGTAGFLPDARILSMRIWFRLRSERPERGHDDNNVYAYADQNFAANDSFRRLLVAKTIYLRTARPAS